MTSSDAVSAALDQLFEREGGLYGDFAQLPLVAQTGHYRRMALLDALDIGDVRDRVCVDFGMGSWGFAGVFPKLQGCREAIGMDLSSSAVEASLKHATDAGLPYAGRFRVHQSDGMRLPLDDASADVIFSGESIEHVRFPLTFLSECHRVLRPGGQLVVTTPNRDAVVYREMGEDYCVSPEHFWLFGYDELIEAVSEFFTIDEAYGFNGAVGPDLDDALVDRALAERWSCAFRDRPDLASGIVLRATKRPDVTHRYAIREVPHGDVRLPHNPVHLDLEFGLRGVLLDRPDRAITIVRPPSDGIVCRFWRHRWSGIASVEAGGTSERLDLYTPQAGWKNWRVDRAAGAPEPVAIGQLGERGARALGDQVIFFESFLYDRTTSG